MKRGPRARRRRGAWVGLGLAPLVWIAFAGGALGELRPLVRDMLGNLAAVNDIGEGVALDDYEMVSRAAVDLLERARRMKKLDTAALELDPAQRAQFDAFLGAQEEAAESVRLAAAGKDSSTVVLGLQSLLGNACLPCHATFREPANRLRPGVLFMTSFLSSWKEINRGLSMNDFSAVTRQARELSTVGRVLSWDQVIQSTFDIDGAEDLEMFRGYLNRFLTEAARIETASEARSAVDVIKASRKMLDDGCLACHRRFRKAR